MTLRVAEESRLANLIGSLQNAISLLERQTENLQAPIAFAAEKEKQNSRNISTLQNSLVDINKRWAPINERLDTLANNVRKVQSNNETIVKEIEEVRGSTKVWMEQIQIGEYERNQRLEKWRLMLEEQANAIDKFNQDWITFSDQYKEAKMAVQTLSGWQKQIEEQQRESAEALRVNTHRLESRWDDFKLENDKKWSTSNIEAEQRVATTNRTYRQLQEQIAALDEILNGLKQEKDLLERIQTAQADAIKQWPRIWLEEVEKAISQNPNRRRQPALVPVREEFD
jgi:chromosome segregation ATPase